MKADEGTLVVGLTAALPAALVLLCVSVFLWRRKQISNGPLEGRRCEISDVVMSMTNRSKKMLDHPEHAAECHEVATEALAMAWSRDNTQPWMLGIAYHTLALSEDNLGRSEDARNSMLRAINIVREWPGCQLAERVQREAADWIRQHDGRGESWKHQGD